MVEYFVKIQLAGGGTNTKRVMLDANQIAKFREYKDADKVDSKGNKLLEFYPTDQRVKPSDFTRQRA